MAIESEKALNEDFNVSTATPTTVLELAQVIWQKIHGDKIPFSYLSDDPYPYDVQYRSPDVSKAKNILGFEAKTSLSQMLDEVIPWIKEQLLIGKI